MIDMIKTLKLYVNKEKIICKEEKKGIIVDISPSITIDSENKIIGLGELRPSEGGSLFWPINKQPMTDKSSIMFTKIIINVMHEVMLSYGWRWYVMLSPKLEVHVGKDLIDLKAWFESNELEIFGVSSIDVLIE